MESGCHYYNDAVGEENGLETSLKRENRDEYKNESIELSNTCGLYVETNVREILAITSIFMESRKGAYPEQLLKIEDKIKEVEKEAGTEEEKPARNSGFIILEGLKMLPSSKLKDFPTNLTNIRLNGPIRVLKKAKHENWNFTVSAIHQLQTDGVLFVGEVTPSAEKGNVLEDCNDLIRVGIFMKDCIDSAVDKGADVK
nr:1700_t:CDS:2 [Entrophospora candida]